MVASNALILKMTNHTSLLATLLTGLALVSARAAEPSAEGLEFFEKKIRPLLAESCFECHSADKKTKGGLRLDSRDGWAKGGDSGPALVPGDVEASLLIKAVRYKDKEFQMPPKRRLSPEQVADFEQWVKLGAPDPRVGTVAAAPAKQVGLSIEAGRKFWAYQQPKKAAPPTVKDASWPRGDIDRFILAQQEAKGIHPAGDADAVTLVRRIYYDLVGLPPTPEQVDAFVRDFSLSHSPTLPSAGGESGKAGKRESGNRAVERLVDQLLASPHFGERWGRHWLDVVRYAESVTLRGFVMKEAWRYRDYVIGRFNADHPYDRFLIEQLAGDLLPSSSLPVKQQQLVATTFLTLGNTNFEEQQKKQLDMDVVDEQLDTIGKAFLGQTIGCARCHDHKFDPIPTRDYYAMAGILKSSKTLEHSNVSKWLEFPLPLPPAEDAKYQQHEKAVAALQAKIKSAKESANQAVATKATLRSGALDAKVLPGVVVDDAQAKRVGEWTASTSTKSFIGDSYVHDSATGKGEKTLTFQPESLRAGKYEVRLAYSPGTNRATNTPVTVFSAEGEKLVRVNQRHEPPVEGRFVSLGQYRFEQNGAGFVIVGNEGTKGHVTADAVQFLPVEMLAEVAAATNAPAAAPADTGKKAKKESRDEAVKKMEAELKQLQDAGPKRPMFMSVKEEGAGDVPIHVRGSAQNLGALAPRGFLQVATYGKPPVIPAQQSGRLQLGEWIASRENPLTARVMANRVWHWLFGAGLVGSTDNFGTTGDAPTHPELLDYLAVRFMDEGWSVKRLVREVMLSRTYQLRSDGVMESRSDAPQHSSTPALQRPIPAFTADPENKLLWHANRRRLDAESIRDTLLLVSGQLQLDVGGPLLKPGTAADYNYKHADTRRSVYAPVLRNSLPELFEAFDFADPSLVMGRRSASTVAPQALFMLNNPFVMEQAQHAAKRLLVLPGLDDRARIAQATRLALGRAPTDGETQLALKFLPADSASADAKKTEAAWAQFYQALFASMDFRYVN